MEQVRKALEMAEAQLQQHLNDQFEAWASHQRDMAKRPDLLAQMIDRYEQPVFPDAVVIMEIRKALQNLSD